MEEEEEEEAYEEGPHSNKTNEEEEKQEDDESKLRGVLALRRNIHVCTCATWKRTSEFL